MGHELKRLAETYPELQLEEIEIVSRDFSRAWKEGIRAFPAIKMGGDILAGLTLDRQKIEEFVTGHLQ